MRRKKYRKNFPMTIEIFFMLRYNFCIYFQINLRMEACFRLPGEPGA